MGVQLAKPASMVAYMSSVNDTFNIQEKLFTGVPPPPIMVIQARKELETFLGEDSETLVETALKSNCKSQHSLMKLITKLQLSKLLEAPQLKESDIARIHSCSGPHAGLWIDTFTRALNLSFSPSEFLRATYLRLGIDQTNEINKCGICSQLMDVKGIHALHIVLTAKTEPINTTRLSRFYIQHAKMQFFTRFWKTKWTRRSKKIIVVI
jgi:hypothetical protein